MTQGNDGFQAALRLPTHEPAGGQTALAIWITEPGGIRPVQAAGGFH